MDVPWGAALLPRLASPSGKVTAGLADNERSFSTGKGGKGNTSGVGGVGVIFC